MRKILLFILLLIPITSFAGDLELKEGDLVFQISKSSQSTYITIAQASPWTHCGIVIKRGIRTYVLEASNTVRIVPFSEWTGKGRFKIIRVKRVFNKDIRIKYQKYLGKKYDLSFKFGNDKYYCSELLYDIYKEQFNYILANPRKVKDYNLIGLSNILKKRGIDKNQLVISPVDIYLSEKSFDKY